MTDCVDDDLGLIMLVSDGINAYQLELSNGLVDGSPACHMLGVVGFNHPVL